MNDLHIVNGGCMLTYFKKEHPFYSVIAFEEAMCAGTAALPILGENFILERCRSLNVSEQEYQKKIVVPLQALKNYSEYVLWFEEDMFCQINLLTLLAYLQQEKLPLPRNYHVVDGEHRQIYDAAIPQADYQKLFEQVVIKKQAVAFPGLLGKGIQRYLTLNQKENELTSYIKEHPQTDRNSLMKTMLRRFSCYGLGDIQYLELIDRLRSQQM